MTAYLLTASAQRDVEGIVAVYAERMGDAVALKVVQSLDAHFARLARSPGIGRPRPEYTPRPVFWSPLKSQMVVYDPAHEPMLVLRVLWARSDLRNRFAEDPGDIQL